MFLPILYIVLLALIITFSYLSFTSFQNYKQNKDKSLYKNGILFIFLGIMCLIVFVVLIIFSQMYLSTFGKLPG